ncbi:MAG: DNA-binding domain-containing protein [Hyphomicrobiaceae bacterium]|nr:DNA-binding domain-containing protein [Hyphomicrobiaceae bacterium]
MKDLASLQEEFQRAVIDGDDAVLAELVDTSKENRAVLLNVYRNAYTERLVEFLSNDYEKLYAYLGEEQFGQMAHGFITANPSATSNARWFGVRLPEFLRETEPYRTLPELGDLAALERALNDVFDAPDAPVLDLADLTVVPADGWPRLTFAPHPATRRLDHPTNATDIWKALHNEEAPPETKILGETRQVIVYRSGGMASFRPLPSDEAMMWDEAAKGVRFSVLCEMLSIYGGEENAAGRAAQHLQRWISSGLLTRFELES